MSDYLEAEPCGHYSLAELRRIYLAPMWELTGAELVVLDALLEFLPPRIAELEAQLHQANALLDNERRRANYHQGEAEALREKLAVAHVLLRRWLGHNPESIDNDPFVAADTRAELARREGQNNGKT